MPRASVRAERFFLRVTAAPRTVLTLTVLLLAACTAMLPRLTRDSSNMANIASDHPARVATDRVKDIFGLTDDGSMVLLVVDENDGGVFDPPTLALIDWLTERVRRLDGVDPEQVKSLATEKNIVGTDWGMEVLPFFDRPPVTAVEAASVGDAVLDFELYVDGLVSRDGRVAVIVLELLDGADDTALYWDLRRVVGDAPTHGETVHVAGIGAFNARIGEYMESDVRRINSLAAIVVVVMLFLAYRSVRGVALPALSTAGGVLTAFAAMSLLGVPVYTLTNTLSVILIAIGVCDGVHILGQYYAERAASPGDDPRRLAVRTMLAMWRPVVVTSATTMVGLLAISATSNVPPARWYGVFGALGVAGALGLSLLTIPAVLTLLAPRPSPVFRSTHAGGAADVFGRMTSAVGRLVFRHPTGCLGLVGVLVVVAGTGASRLQVDNSALNYLQEDEPLWAAFDSANRHIGGMWNLDVLIEASEPEALYRPEHLRHIDGLQRYAETLPNVVTARSIVDYVKQMHRAMYGDDPSFYAIPDDADLIAQYFLAYSASASPTDFEELVDHDFRRANVRIALGSGRASRSRTVVRSVQAYLGREFAENGLRTSLAGWAYLGDHWLADIARSQWLGTPVALLAVAAVTALAFGSLVAGLLAVVPVALAVLVTYGVMGFCGIWMDVASMVLAALAVGVTVDFAVHTLDRLIELLRDQRLPLDEAFERLFASTGRALLFNFAAINFGFGALVVSEIPAVARFGILVVVCVSTSALASLTVLPALVRLVRPQFLGLRRPAAVPRRIVDGTAAVAMLASLLTAASAAAEAPSPELPIGDEVARQINARNEGTALSQRITMELISRQGQRRIREARSYRKDFGDERRIAIFFERPRNIAGTAFLNHRKPGRDDYRWLYLPAMRKVRRIAGADRGGYFLGTDFTYEDIANGSRVAREDYAWRTLRAEEIDGQRCVVVEATPVNTAVADELGYGRVVSWVDTSLWIVRKFEAWDVNLNPLKTVHMTDLRKVDDIWTVHRLEARHAKSGHTSVFTMSDVSYTAPVRDDLFTEQALRAGP